MEVKKSPQADLENKKNIFLEIGLMLSFLRLSTYFSFFVG